ncbi:MAG: RNA polymerase sigma-70 factor [Flavisolibacter sp.]
MNSPEKPYDQFKPIFDEYYNKLCNYAYSFLKDFNSCEDIVQEVFEKIWSNHKDLISDSGIRYYLFTSVRNNCLTRLGKNKKYAWVELNDNDALVNPTLELKEDSTYNYKELLQQAMQQLPPKCKEVFLLSRLGKQSYQEIADQLGISIKTVETQISKALKILRNFAKEYKRP